MNLNLKFSILATLTLGLCSSPLYAEDKTELNLQDKLSYSLGIKAGRSLARDITQQSLDKESLDLEMLMKGLQQGLFENNKPLLSETELRSVFIEFQQQKHKRELAPQQLKMIAALLSTYHLDTGEYPLSLEDLLSNTSDNKYWRGPYVDDKSILTDPWNRPYQYRYPGQDKKHGMNNYDLFSFGADGAVGGQEENADIVWETPEEASSPVTPPPPAPARKNGGKVEAPLDNPSALGPPTEDQLEDTEMATLTPSTTPPTEDKKKFHTLVIHYQQDSWTRVVDLRGKELYSGVAKAGGQVSLTGVPPFDLRFGVTGGVMIEYDGENLMLEEQPGLKNGRITVGVAEEP